MEKKYIKGYIQKAEGDSNTFTVIASTDAQDREGEVIKVDGWELENYLANPVILWAHDISSLPIGKATEVTKDVEGGKLIIKGVFASKEANARAEEVRLLYAEGIQTTVSVGFIPHEREGNIITRAELLELSFVPVPANPEAVAIRKRLNLDASLFEAPEIINRKGYDPARLNKLVSMAKEELKVLPPVEEPNTGTPADGDAEEESSSAIVEELDMIIADVSEAVDAIITEALPTIETALGKQLEGEPIVDELKAGCAEAIKTSVDAMGEAVYMAVEDAGENDPTADVTMEVEDTANTLVDSIAQVIETKIADMLGAVGEGDQAKAEADVAPVIADIETKIEDSILALLDESIAPLIEACRNTEKEEDTTEDDTEEPGGEA